jgi:hypothetical protein
MSELFALFLLMSPLGWPLAAILALGLAVHAAVTLLRGASISLSVGCAAAALAARRLSSRRS